MSSSNATAWILALGLGLVAPVLAAAPGPARADGDPASDELIGANVFYPFSPPVAAGLQKSLNAETRREPPPLPDQGGADRLEGRSRGDPEPVRQAAGVRRLPRPGDQLRRHQAAAARRDAGRLRRRGLTRPATIAAAALAKPSGADKATTWHRPRSSPCRSSPPRPVIRSPECPAPVRARAAARVAAPPGHELRRDRAKRRRARVPRGRHRSRRALVPPPAGTDPLGPRSRWATGLVAQGRAAWRLA